MNGLSQGVFSIAGLIPTTNLLLLCVPHELYCIVLNVLLGYMIRLKIA